MGLLDDAIREHLELKRQHGANEDELARQEAEALGPVTDEDLAVGEDPIASGANGERETGWPFDRVAEDDLAEEPAEPSFEWSGRSGEDIDVPSFVSAEPASGPRAGEPEPRAGDPEQLEELEPEAPPEGLEPGAPPEELAPEAPPEGPEAEAPVPELEADVPPAEEEVPVDEIDAGVPAVGPETELMTPADVEAATGPQEPEESADDALAVDELAESEAEEPEPDLGEHTEAAPTPDLLEPDRDPAEPVEPALEPSPEELEGLGGPDVDLPQTEAFEAVDLGHTGLESSGAYGEEGLAAGIDQEPAEDALELDPAVEPQSSGVPSLERDAEPEPEPVDPAPGLMEQPPAPAPGAEPAAGEVVEGEAFGAEELEPPVPTGPPLAPDPAAEQGSPPVPPSDPLEGDPGPVTQAWSVVDEPGLAAVGPPLEEAAFEPPPAAEEAHLGAEEAYLEAGEPQLEAEPTTPEIDPLPDAEKPGLEAEEPGLEVAPLDAEEDHRSRPPIRAGEPGFETGSDLEPSLTEPEPPLEEPSSGGDMGLEAAPVEDLPAFAPRPDAEDGPDFAFDPAREPGPAPASSQADVEAIDEEPPPEPPIAARGFFEETEEHETLWHEERPGGDPDFEN